MVSQCMQGSFGNLDYFQETSSTAIKTIEQIIETINFHPEKTPKKPIKRLTIGKYIIFQ